MPCSSFSIITRFPCSILLIFYLLSCYSSAIRPLEDRMEPRSQDFMTQRWRPRQEGSSEFVLDHQRLAASAPHDGHKTAYSSHHLVFSFLPKGTPVPPSGPSERHNSIQN